MGVRAGGGGCLAGGDHHPAGGMPSVDFMVDLRVLYVYLRAYVYLRILYVYLRSVCLFKEPVCLFKLCMFI